MLRVLTIGLLFLAQSMSFADSRALLSPSAEALNQAMALLPDPMTFPQKATDEALQESVKALSTLERTKPVMPSMPKLDLMNIPAPSPIDIGRLSLQGEALLNRNDEQASRYESQVLVFVSASMPDTTVKRYVQQTQKIGAALVFRGLVNDSMKDMQRYLSKILGTDHQSVDNPTILIDPTLYSRFDIKQVPTTVVTESEIKPCQQDGCPIPVHHKVAGDVSLIWSLELVSRQVDSTQLKATLRPLIKDMERL